MGWDGMGGGRESSKKEKGKKRKEKSASGRDVRLGGRGKVSEVRRVMRNNDGVVTTQEIPADSRLRHSPARHERTHGLTLPSHLPFSQGGQEGGGQSIKKINHPQHLVQFTPLTSARACLFSCLAPAT